MRRLIIAAVILVQLWLHAQEVSVGSLLVGTRKSRDPDLGQAVILLIHSDANGAIGLMLNRPSKIKDSKALVYAGGPVTIGVRALCRGAGKPEKAIPVLSDVYLIATKPLPSSDLTGNDACRIYAGYTGWTLGQLKSEVALGLWRVLPASAKIVFDQHPEDLWKRMTILR